MPGPGYVPVAGASYAGDEAIVIRLARAAGGGVCPEGEAVWTVEIVVGFAGALCDLLGRCTVTDCDIDRRALRL